MCWGGLRLPCYIGVFTCQAGCKSSAWVRWGRCWAIKTPLEQGGLGAYWLPFEADYSTHMLKAGTRLRAVIAQHDVPVGIMDFPQDWEQWNLWVEQQ